MDVTMVSGYFLALLVGVSLGLIGSGGSILTVPILVYILTVNPVLATAYSLFVVGSTALVGGVRNAFNKNVDFSIVWIFGIPSLMAAYLVRAFVIPAIPDVVFSAGTVLITKSLLLMVLFAVVMLTASVRMIKSGNSGTIAANIDVSYSKLVVLGVLIGVLAGAVGAGGGFLIIPALVFLAHMPMKKAVGTSLFIIAIQSLAGFMGDVGQSNIDWSFLLVFTLMSVIGIFIGIALSNKIPGEKLKTGFGWFVLIMGIYILIKEIFM
ncbi:sulfite exporter TauE/SafE family protein [Flavobacterium alkalisoli]|uniref:Probable membrane transporter protein n=1 Tax=Flavobacterium alkalisoli TaxID=2602769 RepID=A0A5B9FRY5_9FLAO|nr:sulfite exporter TauE/SafE family protein [Flavobacterium alkalisoli]QEE49760.1 sulfite exporter TauE/SafE family protein [Flavobacterium alkalisoli]